MTDELRNLLKSNQDLLKKNDFEKLLQLSVRSGLEEELLDFLYNNANIDILKFINTIHGRMFYETNIPSLIIPANIKKIEDQGIYGCGVVRLAIENPDIKMEPGAIWNNPSLQVVNLPEGMNSLPSAVFQNCMNLKKVRIPASVTRIGARCFRDCNDDFVIVTPYRENTRDKLIILQSEVEFYKKHLRFTHAPKNVEVENEI